MGGSTLSLKLASECGPPGLVEDPSTADADSPTPKSIKIEGQCSPSAVAVPCMKGLSGPIDVPEPEWSPDSVADHFEISLTPCAEAADLQGTEDSMSHSDVEVAMPISEASISAAVRAASGRDNDTSSTDEVDVVMPTTDASISAAVRVAHQSTEEQVLPRRHTSGGLRHERDPSERSMV